MYYILTWAARDFNLPVLSPEMKFSMTVVDPKSNPPTVELYDANTGTSLSSELIKSGYAIYNTGQCIANPQVCYCVMLDSWCFIMALCRKLATSFNVLRLHSAELIIVILQFPMTDVRFMVRNGFPPIISHSFSYQVLTEVLSTPLLHTLAILDECT